MRDTVLTLTDDDLHRMSARGVWDIRDADLIERAVRSARSHRYARVRHSRWVGVMDAFGLGSTYAYQLCRRFGLDPDEQVKR